MLNLVYIKTEINSVYVEVYYKPFILGLAPANIYIPFNQNNVNMWTEKCICIDQSRNNIQLCWKGLFKPNGDVIISYFSGRML